jgi:hypothetical protein
VLREITHPIDSERAVHISRSSCVATLYLSSVESRLEAKRMSPQ